MRGPDRGTRRAGAVIDRASATDRAFLAMNIGPVPEQFGAILRFAPGTGPTVTRVRAVITERLAGVPRLRQRLIGTPLGCGGPIWVDDPEFDVRRHVRLDVCRAPGDDAALGETALAALLTPLPRSAPLWSVVVVTGLADGGSALVVVLSHGLADGLGGIALLQALLDPGTPRDPGAATGFPRPRPLRSALFRDVWHRRSGAVRHSARWWRLLRRSLFGAGGLRPPRAVPCSLVAPTGPRRALVTITRDRAALSAAAHRAGATTNDAVLVAVAGALHRVLGGRGEQVDSLSLTLPVSGRSDEDESSPGNLISPILIEVPALGPPAHRLAEVRSAVLARRASATGPPVIALLGWLFRPLARWGGHRFYLNRQRRFHSIVSHVRVPERPLAFDGHLVSSVVPLGVGQSGNITVSFVVVSHRDVLTVVAIADPERFPELEELAAFVGAELDLIVDSLADPTSSTPADRGSAQ